MIINKREEKGVIILEPDGRLDSNTSPILEQEISHIDSGSDGYHLLVDFLNIDYISSAGLRVILKAFKERQEGPKFFAVSGMQEHVREVFEISGFDSYIANHPDCIQAIKSLIS